jgi:hypothetical protein
LYLSLIPSLKECFIAISGVITRMGYQVGEIFRSAREELIETLGNEFLTFDKNKNQLPQEIRGLLETRAYKEYLRRILKTTDDISFLEPDFFVANKSTPTVFMKIWDREDQFIQNQRIGAILYLTNVDDPIKRIVRNL